MREPEHAYPAHPAARHRGRTARSLLVTRFLLVLAATFLAAMSPAFAACNAPSSEAGDIIYNSDYRMMQFCDGINWVAMGQTDFSESDPEVGNVSVAGNLCRANGSSVQCDLANVLTSLGNVNAPAPNAGEVLLYSAGSGQWVAGPVVATSLNALDDIDDVTITGAVGGDVVYYSAALGQWVNKPLSASDVTAAGADRQIQFNAGGILGADPLFVFSSAGNLGLGTASPRTLVDLTGTLRLSDGGEACGPLIEGAMRYGSTSLWLCEGTGWTAIVDGNSAVTQLDDLSDVALSGIAGGQVLYYSAGAGRWINRSLTVAELPAMAFTDLADTPSLYTGSAGAFVRVSAGENGLEFGTIALADLPAIALNDLSDTLITAPAAGKVLYYSAGASAWVDQTLVLNDFGDAAITGPSGGEVLYYSAGAGQWVNRALALPDIAAAGTDREIFFRSGGLLVSESLFVFDSTGNLGIGTAAPQAQLDIAGTGAILLPRGDTGQRPAGVNGMLRYNSATGRFEGYQGGGWQDILTGSVIAALDDLSNVDVPAPADGNLLFYNNASGNWEALSPGADRQIVFNSAGQLTGAAGFVYTATGLGLGTSSPSDLLHVAGGQIRLDNDTNPAAEGCLRFNGVSSQMEFSNDCAAWTVLGEGLWSDSGAGYIQYDSSVGGIRITGVTGASAPTVVGNSTLAGMLDTNIPLPLDGQVLTYDSASGFWISATPSIATLNDVGDVTISAAAAGQVLYYSGGSGQWINRALTLADLPASAFTDLSDTPSLYTGSAGAFVRVNASETGLALGTIALSDLPAIALNDLSDATISGAAGGQVLYYSAGAGQWINRTLTVADLPTSAFTELGDTPSVYTGSAGAFVRVNAGATGLIFATAALADLGDIDVTGLLDTQVLTYNSAAGLWTGQTPIRYLTELLDVDAAAPGDGELLFYNNATGNWEPLAAGADRQITFNNAGTLTGASTFVYTATGDLGIGTAAPSDRLHVAGGQIRLDNDTNPAAEGCLRYNGVTAKMEFSHDCAAWSVLGEGLWSDSAAGYIQYDSALGGIRITGVTGASQPVVLGVTTLDGLTDTNLGALSDGECLMYSSAGGEWINSSACNTIPAGANTQVQYNNNGTFGASANFVYTATGSLGLGTASPSDRLHVAGGQFRLDNDTNTTNEGCIRYNGTGNRLQFSHDCSTFYDIAGVGNIAIDDLTDAISDGESIFFGVGAGISDDGTLNNNIAIGKNALTSVTSGTRNIAVGLTSMQSVTTGFQNVAIGGETLTTTVTGIANVAVGQGALRFSSGSYDTAVGYQALREAAYSGEGANVAVGAGALVGAAGMTGIRNVAVGRAAMMNDSTGSNNVAIGWQALIANTAGNNNSAVGHQALTANTTGGDNAALGYWALMNNTTGEQNTALGLAAMGNNAAADGDMDRNTAIGYHAGYNFAGGAEGAGPDNNILIGWQAGDLITTGDGNIIIGYNVDPPTATTSNHLNIGNTIYGDLATGNVGIGTTTPGAKLEVAGDIQFTGVLYDTSDIRLKTAIKPLEGSLQKLLALSGISFVMKDDEDGQVEFGFAAQDVQKVFPALVHAADDEMGTLSLNTIGLIAPAVEAIKELSVEQGVFRADFEALRRAQAASLEALRDEMTGWRESIERRMDERDYAIALLQDRVAALEDEGVRTQAAFAAIHAEMKEMKAYTGYGVDRAGIRFWLIVFVIGLLSFLFATYLAKQMKPKKRIKK